MDNLLTYAGIVYVTVVVVKVVNAGTVTKETVVAALKWPYDLVMAIVNKVRE